MSKQDDFEVVWNGGPLLPPRSSVPDRLWLKVPTQDNEPEVRVRNTAKAREALRRKRLYQKKHGYWQGRGGSSPLRPRLVGEGGSHSPAGTRTPRHQLEPLSPVAVATASAT